MLENICDSNGRVGDAVINNLFRMFWFFFFFYPCYNTYL